MRRRLSGVAMFSCAVVLASCGGPTIPAVPAVVSAVTVCLHRAGLPVGRAPGYLITGEAKTRVVQKEFQPGELGVLTVGTGPAYVVWIWDSQRRARTFAQANGLTNGFDVIGTSIAGPFSSSGPDAALLLGTSQADRTKIESCLRRAHA